MVDLAMSFTQIKSGVLRRKKGSEARGRAAEALRNLLRRGVPIETTCRENGWGTSAVWNCLQLSKAYRKHTESKVPKESPLHNKTLSKSFPKELDFEALVASRIGVPYQRRAWLSDADAEADILITGSKVVIECKVSVKTHDVYVALGQILNYKAAGYTPLLCVPSDVSIPSRARMLIEREATITSEQCVAQIVGLMR